jgi:hypothetical protein
MAEPLDQAVEQRHLDVRAVARRRPAEEGGEHPAVRVHAAGDVGDADAAFAISLGVPVTDTSPASAWISRS